MNASLTAHIKPFFSMSVFSKWMMSSFVSVQMHIYRKINILRTVMHYFTMWKMVHVNWMYVQHASIDVFAILIELLQKLQFSALKI